MTNRKGILLIFLLLSGCINGYQPKLAQPIEDKEQYDIDRKDCIEEAKERMKIATQNHPMAGSFGLIGVLIASQNIPKDDDWHKDAWEITDECMKDKGYILAPK